VTEAGRNKSTEHLEQHFVHEYTPIRTHVVGEVPDLKKFSTPKSWKRNIRAARWVPSPVCCTGLQALSTCTAQNCTHQCSDVTAVHRTELADSVQKVWQEQGETGLRVYLERLIDVRETNLETMAKHGERCAADCGVDRLRAVGWDAGKKREKNPNQRCCYCRECSDPCLYDSHHFEEYFPAGSKKQNRAIRKKSTGCPRREEGEEYFEEKKQRWLDTHKKTCRRYYVPPSSHKPRSAHIQVCRSTFIAVFNLGRKGVLLDNLGNRDHSQPITLEKSKRTDISRSRYDTEIADHLASFPRITSHYSNSSQQDKARHFEDHDLCPAKLWQLFLEKHDPDFAQQAAKYSFWTTYDRRAPPELPDGEPWLRPMIAHSTYSYKLSKYDVHFGQLKVDTCPTCDAFRQSIAGFDNGAAKAKLEADWGAHKKVADSYYAAHKADEARTDREFALVNWQYDPSAEFCCAAITETQCQDAAGNLRCPRLTVGEAYYKRILPVWIYGINSRGGKCTTICAWNETLGTKGANEVISCEHYHHMHNGTGAETLELWEDMCGGQIFNLDGAMYHCHITDPDSPMHMYGRIDEKTHEKGHSYSVCDREFANPQRLAKKRAVISDIDEWLDIYRESKRSNPFKVHKMEQSEFRDWRAYLKQFYIRTRKSVEGLKVAFQGAHWRNYGYGPELQEDGIVRIVHHPGEIWYKYNLDERTPWVKVDMRRNCTKSYQNQRVVGADGVITNVLTCNLPALKTKPKPISHDDFTLYTELLPISKAKYDDLVDLCPYLPEDKRQQYIDLKYDASKADDDNGSGEVCEESDTACCDDSDSDSD
jgi:hypothetical protein